MVWQARRDSNPQPTDLESAALPLELLAYPKLLLSFSVRSMLPAEFAILLLFELIRGLLFILGGAVILTLALGTIQPNDNAHFTTPV
jgi:hypothetical protein